MSNRKHTLLLGYARRMEEVARLAAEMSKIEATYRREFGGDAWDAALKDAMTGERLARLHASLVADRPEPAQEPAEDVLEPVRDTAGAPALGLVPAPVLLNDGLGDNLTVAEQRTRDEDLTCVGCFTNAGPHSEVEGVCTRV